MPTYRYRCDECGDYEQWRSIHGPSGSDCPKCGVPALQVMTPPNLSVYATSKGQAAANRIAHDEQLAKDLPAYKELRHQGFQPPKVDGSAVLQRDARDRLEVELGRRIPKADLSRAREVQQELAESKREGAFAGAFGDHQRSQR